MNSASFDSAPRLPEILDLQASADSLVIQARVPADLLYLRGHFNCAPVVAGIVQLQWAQHYARRQFNLSGGIQRMEQVKFQRLLRPPESFTLSLDWQRAKSSVAFRIYYGERRYSSGRMLFGPPAR